MIHPYKVFVTQEGKFELVDTRDDVDTSHYLAETTSTWKKIVTAGQRRYYSTTHDLIGRPGTYVLTYPDNSVTLANPSKGDYVPPGFTRVSRELRELFSGYDGKKCVSRSRIIPLHGNVVNPRFTVSMTRRHACLYRGRAEKDYLLGWSMFQGSEQGYYTYTDKTDEGIMCRHSSDTVLISQTLTKEKMQGRTRVVVRLTGGESPEDDTSAIVSRAVMLDTTPLACIRDTDDWVWEGDPIEKDILLSIEINGNRRLKCVEVLDD